MSSRRRTLPGKGALAGLCLILIALSASGALAQTRTVNSLADDSSPGTLRYEIGNAFPADIIDITVTGTILLVGGDIPIESNLTIIGPGARDLTVDANYTGRIFNVGAGVVSISGMTLARGLAQGMDGSPGSPADGGGPGMGGILLVQASAAVTLADCELRDGQAVGGMGGEWSEDGAGGGGAGLGGGVYVESAGVFNALNCLFDNNQALGGQGGMENFAGGGGAGMGGALFNNGTSTLTNCTFAFNTATGAQGRFAGTNNSTPMGAAAAGGFGYGGSGYGHGGNGCFGGCGGGGCATGAGGMG
ncbi:MAG: hypothetical protein ABIJ95_04030, partial [Pseudomonadota bacterium]